LRDGILCNTLVEVGGGLSNHLQTKLKLKLPVIIDFANWIYERKNQSIVKLQSNNISDANARVTSNAEKHRNMKLLLGALIIIINDSLKSKVFCKTMIGSKIEKVAPERSGPEVAQAADVGVYISGKNPENKCVPHLSMTYEIVGVKKIGDLVIGERLERPSDFTAPAGTNLTALDAASVMYNIKFDDDSDCDAYLKPFYCGNLAQAVGSPFISMNDPLTREGDAPNYYPYFKIQHQSITNVAGGSRSKKRSNLRKPRRRKPKKTIRKKKRSKSRRIRR